MDHPRGPRRLLHRVRAAPASTRARDCPASWSRPTPTASRSRAPERKMGLRLRHGPPGHLRRRPGARRADGRRRGTGHVDRPVRAGLRAPGHRGLRRRPGPGGARLRVVVRQERQQFGRPISEFQGLSFLLADMEATEIVRRPGALPARGPAARRRPTVHARRPPMAKLFATDTAMRVTTDAVQVLGGYGYVARTSRPSATCVRPRCSRSSRAPTRSSGWSSPASCCAADRRPAPRSRKDTPCRSTHPPSPS